MLQAFSGFLICALLPSSHAAPEGGRCGAASRSLQAWSLTKTPLFRGATRPDQGDSKGLCGHKLRAQKPHLSRTFVRVERRVEQLLMQFGVLGFGFLQNGDVLVGIFPECKEIFVGGERSNASGIGIRALHGS
jgi:hypothetical protein